jgi:RNA polymerase sigma-70 factor (ECF subfamily)
MSRLLKSPGIDPRRVFATSERPGSAETASLSDEELMTHLRHKEYEAAYSELIRRYSPELARYLRRFVDADTAEDLAQTTLLNLHEKCSLYHPGKALRPWLYGIATHLAIDSWRRSRRRAERSLESASGDGVDQLPLRERLGDDVLRPDESVADQETRDRVLAAVSQLPEHLRSVVMLVHFHGLKYAEAAEALHIPIGTVKSRLYQARRALRRSSIRSNEA